MSRTRKHAKSPGFEYWTRRPGNSNGGLPGKFTKRRTHKAERRDYDPIPEFPPRQGREL